uniref:Exportin-2 n=1 Tax=Syphacia muris TaxID=451379 RepID=A0A0N5AQY9_9BILA
MIADLASVSALLAQTLQPDASTRRTAEEQLRQISHSSGFGRQLAQLSIDVQAPQEIRLAAAVNLKNYIKKNWNLESSEIEITDADRLSLRNDILPCMYAATGNIRKQMSEIVCTIGKYDFPKAWPELITNLVSHLNANEMDVLIATLTAMNELFRRYRHESKSTELWMEIKFVLDNAAPAITELFSRMLQQIPQKDTMSEADSSFWVEVLYLIIGVFHSLSAQDLPAYFEDNIGTYMNGCLALLRLNVAVIDNSSSDSEPNILDNLKSSICEILTLYSQRYEEEISPFMKDITEHIWGLLIEMDFRIRFDSVVDAALGFLSAICMRPQYSAMFEVQGVLKTLCEDIIIKNLMLRQCDLELFEDEPLEFIKKDIEGSDIGTRRRGAGDFVRALCRRFEQEVTNILSGVISVYLNECAINLNVNWLKKDVIYCLVIAMASKSETLRFGSTSTSELVDVVDFYKKYVHSDLFVDDVDSLPVLRIDAIKYLVIFRNQLQQEQLLESLAAVVRLLNSRHGIVHQYAAYAIERIMLVRDKQNQLIFSRANTQAGPIISALFSTFDRFPQAQNSHYIMKAVMRCLNIMDVETAKKSGEIVNKLAIMIGAAVKNPVDSLHLHFMFESLCIIIRQAYSAVEGGIDQYIIPVIESIFSNEIMDYVPYALQITALLLDEATSQKPEAINSYLSFLPFLMNDSLWMHHANVPAGILVIESFLRCRADEVLAQYAGKILAILTRLIGIKAQDQHGFKLGNALLPYLNKNSALTEPLLLTPMLRRVQFAKTSKFMKQFVIFISRFVIMRSATSFLQALESLQAGMYHMVIEKIMIAELKNMGSTTTYEEKRIVCIGVAKLISDTVEGLSDLYGPLVESIVSLVEASGCGPTSLKDEEERAEAYTEMGSALNDPYCKLTYAQHVDAVAPEITNFKAYLGQAVMMRASTVRPESIACISEESRNHLSSYLQS